MKVEVKNWSLFATADNVTSGTGLFPLIVIELFNVNFFK